MSKNQNNFSIYKDETFNTTVSNLVKWDYSEAFPITATLTESNINLTISNYSLSFPGMICKNGNMYILVMNIYSSDITITADNTYTELLLSISPLIYTGDKTFTSLPAIAFTSGSFSVPITTPSTAIASYGAPFLNIQWTSSTNAGTSPIITVNIPFVA